MSKPGSMTAGPWEAVDTGADVWEIVSPSRGVIAEASHHRVECKANARAIAALPPLVALAEHIAAMADDAYLVGHPEWIEIANEAARILARIEGGK